MIDIAVHCRGLFVPLKIGFNDLLHADPHFRQRCRQGLAWLATLVLVNCNLFTSCFAQFLERMRQEGASG